MAELPPIDLGAWRDDTATADQMFNGDIVEELYSRNTNSGQAAASRSRDRG